MIDTVEAAVNILLHGFSDWSADCPNQDSPSIEVDTSGFHVHFGSLVLEKAGGGCGEFDAAKGD